MFEWSRIFHEGRQFPQNGGITLYEYHLFWTCIYRHELVRFSIKIERFRYDLTTNIYMIIQSNGYTKPVRYDSGSWCFVYYFNHKQCYYQNSFFPKSMKLWNNLPHELKTCNQSVSSFRRQLSSTMYNEKLSSYSQRPRRGIDQKGHFCIWPKSNDFKTFTSRTKIFENMESL